VSRISPDKYEYLINSSIEEFVCDLAALNAYCSLKSKEPLERDKFINDYLQYVIRSDKNLSLAKKYGFFPDPHPIARITMSSMFEQFEALGIDKGELVPTMYKCAKEILQDYKTGVVKRKNIRFPSFLEDVCKKLESCLPVTIDVKPAEVEINENILKQLREEIISINNLNQYEIESLDCGLNLESGKVEKLPLVLAKSAS
jgi:hypothetical protein